MKKLFWVYVLLILIGDSSLNAQDKPPVANCLTGVITVPMPFSGCVTVWAIDLNRGSFDDITPDDKLKFYFNGDTSKISITICCDDFIKAGVLDELMVPLTMYVKDESHQFDSCKTQIIFQDINDICPTICPFNDLEISGTIRCLNGECLPTNIGGDPIQVCDFRITGLNRNSTYKLCFTKNDHHENGLTAADISKIRKHILGIEEFNSPYKYLAADVNKTKTITAADISEIKKLILGINKEFTKVPNWVFIVKDSVIPSPWNFQEINSCIEFKLKDCSITNLQIIGIKMGDVNMSARCK